MIHIKNYENFLNESNGSSDAVTDLFRSLTRNYETTRVFFTDQVQYSAEEEHKDWKKPADHVKMQTPITHDAHYMLVFRLDGKGYQVDIDFNFTFDGKKEKDAPETAYDEQMARLNIFLEDVNVKKVKVRSQNLNFEQSVGSMEDSLKKAITVFLVKMLSTEYDSLGGKIYSLEQI